MMMNMTVGAGQVGLTKVVLPLKFFVGLRRLKDDMLFAKDFLVLNTGFGKRPIMNLFRTFRF